MGVDSASELLDEVVRLLGVILSSFNQKEFPNKTKEIIQPLNLIIGQNLKVLKTKLPAESQLRDALIDLQRELTKYKIDLEKDGDLKIAAERKDFVEGRAFFKPPIYKKFVQSLKPKDANLPSPSTIWKKECAQLERMFR